MLLLDGCNLQIFILLMITTAFAFFITVHKNIHYDFININYICLLEDTFLLFYRLSNIGKALLKI